MSLEPHEFRNKLMEIIEELAPIFKNRTKFGERIQAKFLSINDLSIRSYDTTETHTEILAIVSLQSDSASWEQELLIRNFHEETEFKDELDRFSELERRFATTENVDPTPLINVNKENLRVIYDLGELYPLSWVNTKIPGLDASMGKLIAMLQGSEMKNLKFTSLRDIMGVILKYVPISDIEKKNISQLLEPHYPIIDNTNGGYVPCTFFDPEQIKIQFAPNNEFYFLVPPKQPESNIVDRMADIALYFTERAQKEFMSTGSLDETKMDVQEFFVGYNTIFSVLSDQNLYTVYPHGITLDLQMLINFVLYEMKNSDRPFSNPDCVRYLYFLLLKKPFLLY